MALVMVAGIVAPAWLAAQETAKPAFAIYFNSEVKGMVDPCG